jgi:hypothetical protein
MAQDAKTVSIREYARSKGVSDTAVRKAIKSRKINAGYNAESKKIIPEIADREWGDTIIQVTPENLPADKPTANTANAEPSAQEITSDGIVLDRDETYAEALRKDLIIKANLNALKLRMKEGEVVEKSKVYKELFAFGKQIRLRFQSVPDRVIDDVLAAPGRNDAHLILFNAITDVLEELTSVGETELKI